MRLPSTHGDNRSDMGTAMTPMIDVVFLLLVFFLWTASFQVVEMILPSSLTVARGSEQTEAHDPPPEADFDEVVVRIRMQGERVVWQVNDQPVDSFDQVRDRLQVIAGIHLDAPVILHPDGEVPLGSVIDVYDAARLAGFDKIQFAASQEI